MTVESINFQEFKPSIGLPGYDPLTAPDVQLATVSNQWVKVMSFKKVGDYIPGHIHNFDHISLLVSGSVEVLVNGQTTMFEAPKLIYIQKGTQHQITALTALTVLACIHALRDDLVSENIIAEDMIPRGASPLSTISDFNLARITQPFT
jgi:mannose-6-phosphate isomerase-like protein (cupin superfamily)